MGSDELRVTASAGGVSVTVDAGGVVVDIAIAERVVSRRPRELGDLVLTAMRKALAELSDLLRCL